MRSGPVGQRSLTLCAHVPAFSATQARTPWARHARAHGNPMLSPTAGLTARLLPGPGCSSDKVESGSLKVVSVVGARPQFIKLAPISAAFNATHHEHLVIHTGQHYDVDLSDVFFTGLRLREPDFHLGVGSGTHGVQTGAILSGLDPVLEALHPDWVLVYGDTNSTLAAALSAVKQHLKVAHLEAGLRSFNRRMPEEHNRVLTDHAADLLLAPTQVAVDHLAAEGLAARTVLVGDVMTDVLLTVRDGMAERVPQLPAGVDPAA